MPAAFFGDIDADDVPGPAGEQRLAGADPVIFLLGLSLMAGGRSIRLAGDRIAARAGGGRPGSCGTTRRGAGTLHGGTGEGVAGGWT